jgi:hypothetical protein
VQAGGGLTRVDAFVTLAVAAVQRDLRRNTVPKWRNWQTRMVQVHVPARVWGFESLLRHQSFRISSLQPSYYSSYYFRPLTDGRRRSPAAVVSLAPQPNNACIENNSKEHGLGEQDCFLYQSVKVEGNWTFKKISETRLRRLSQGGYYISWYTSSGKTNAVCRARTGRGSKTHLRLPDLDYSKTAVLNSLTSVDGQRGYGPRDRRICRLVLLRAATCPESNRGSSRSHLP